MLVNPIKSAVSYYVSNIPCAKIEALEMFKNLSLNVNHRRNLIGFRETNREREGVIPLRAYFDTPKISLQIVIFSFIWKYSFFKQLSQPVQTYHYTAGITKSINFRYLCKKLFSRDFSLFKCCSVFQGVFTRLCTKEA